MRYTYPANVNTNTSNSPRPPAHLHWCSHMQPTASECRMKAPSFVLWLGGVWNTITHLHALRQFTEFSRAHWAALSTSKAEEKAVMVLWRFSRSKRILLCFTGRSRAVARLSERCTDCLISRCFGGSSFCSVNWLVHCSNVSLFLNSLNHQSPACFFVQETGCGTFFKATFHPSFMSLSTYCVHQPLCVCEVCSAQVCQSSSTRPQQMIVSRLGVRGTPAKYPEGSRWNRCL